MKQLYDLDFQLWLEKTINSLEKRDFADLDINHLIEELTELGKSERKALASNLMILLAHLLKTTVQFDVPEMMKNSWYNSIDEHRQRVLFDLQETPSLKSYLATGVEKAYPNARQLAIKEGQKAKYGIRVPQDREYPLICPFSIEEILDEDFYGKKLLS
jgi:hypothetical protein